MERALFAITALALNAALFSPGVRARLPLVPGEAIRSIERKLNRPQRSVKTRHRRGALLVVATMLGALGLGCLLGVLHWRFLDIALLALSLSVRPTWDRASDIRRALARDDTASARLALKGSVWRHYALLDAHALARAGIELLSVNFTGKILSPIFWYLLLGLPGLLMAKGIYWLEEHLCQPIATESAFGSSTHWVHSLGNYIPARLSAMLWSVATVFLQGSSLLQALKQTLSGISHREPEAVCVLASACALDLSLGGPTSVYTGGQWLGSGSAKATHSDIKRAQYVWGILQGVLVLMLAMMV